MTARPTSRLVAYLRHRWMVAILALAFVGVLQLIGSGAAHAHAVSHHASTHAQNAELIQPLERQAVVIGPAIGGSDHIGCQGHDIPTSGHKAPTCCGTPCCAAALAATPDLGVTLSNRIVAITRFHPLFIMADIVFGLDRPPDFRV